VVSSVAEEDEEEALELEGEVIGRASGECEKNDSRSS
jgi:hypothetical protein